ncbi:MAG: penicillin-binding transpeptidase domain-containing protein [Verrucomicrobiota bacterium]
MCSAALQRRWQDRDRAEIVNGTYRRDKHFSSFIGFFPADNPEVCIGVFLDEPKNGYYGGEAAAPIFREMAERVGKYLAIEPDIAPPPPATASASGRRPLLASHGPDRGLN